MAESAEREASEEVRAAFDTGGRRPRFADPRKGWGDLALAPAWGDLVRARAAAAKRRD
jgi:hypothetical protein